MCGSIKYKPHFQLAMSSYDGELTLSSNLYGSEDDRQRILSFLDEVERELPEIGVAEPGRCLYPGWRATSACAVHAPCWAQTSPPLPWP